MGGYFQRMAEDNEREEERRDLLDKECKELRTQLTTVEASRDGYKAKYEELEKAVNMFMPSLIKVTALHRHNAPMRKQAMDNLCNMHLELEAVLTVMKGK